MMKRKITALILVCIMVLPVFSVGAVTADETELSKINESTAGKLNAFGLLERDDMLFYEEKITRGSFVEYCSRLLGEGFQASKNTNPFADVTEIHQNYESIILFYELGYISGTNGTKFRPDDLITVEEASKILLEVLGYGEVKSSIPYPSGYLKIAYRLDLFSALNSDGYIDAYEMAEIMLNTLHAPILDATTFYANNGEFNGASYTDRNTETLLVRNFGINYWEGILEDNKYTSLYEQSQVDENFVIINGKTFNAGETSAVTMIGYYLNIYFNEENDISTIIYCEKDRLKNSETAIRGEQVIASSITPIGLSYKEKDSSKKQNIATERALVMIYNGVVYPYSNTFITDSDAYLVYLDNDNDRKAEMVLVMDYKTVVVGNISSNGLVTDELSGQQYDLNPETKDFDVVITDENGKLSLGDILPGDVISIAIPKGDNPVVKYVKVSRKTVDGTVTQMDEDGIYIDDVFYEITSECRNASILGWGGTFMLDSFGVIVHKVIKRDMVYGYLNLIYKENREVKASIFTENDRWVELKFKDSFKFNTSKKKAKEFYEEYGSSTDNYRQLVRYRVNQQGEIIELLFAEETDPLSDSHYTKMNNGVFTKKTLNASVLFKSTISGFVRELKESSHHEQLMLTSETKVFVIPYQAENECADEEEFLLLGMADVAQEERYTNVIGYDCDEFSQAKACVLLDSSTRVNPRSKVNNNFMLVTDLRKGVLEDGEVTDIICGWFSGTEISIKTADNTIIGTNVSGGAIHPGDIIRFALDKDGNIIKIEMRYCINTAGATPEIGDDDFWSTNEFVAGEVEQIDSKLNRIVFSCGSYSYNGGTYRRNVIATTNSVSSAYLYDVNEKEAKKISVADIQPGDYIYGLLSYYRFNQLVVYRN